MSTVMAVAVVWLALIAAMVAVWHQVMQRADRPVMMPMDRRNGAPSLPVQRGTAPDTRTTPH